MQLTNLVSVLAAAVTVSGAAVGPYGGSGNFKLQAVGIPSTQKPAYLVQRGPTDLIWVTDKSYAQEWSFNPKSATLATNVKDVENGNVVARPYSLSFIHGPKKVAGTSYDWVGLIGGATDGSSFSFNANNILQHKTKAGTFAFCKGEQDVETLAFRAQGESKSTTCEDITLKAVF